MTRRSEHDWCQTGSAAPLATSWGIFGLVLAVAGFIGRRFRRAAGVPR